MSTYLDTILIPRIQEIIDRLGTSATFTTTLIDEDDYNPKTGEITYSTLSTISVKVSPPQNVSYAYIDGEIIKEGDQMIYLPAKDLTFTPREGMKITIGSKDWKVLKLNLIYTGDDLAMYILFLGVA